MATVEAGSVAARDGPMTAGAVPDLGLVLAIQRAVAHIDFVEFFVEIILRQFGFFSQQLPEGLADHQRLAQIHLQPLDLPGRGLPCRFITLCAKSRLIAPTLHLDRSPTGRTSGRPYTIAAAAV